MELYQLLEWQGGAVHPLPKLSARKYAVIELENVGREGHTFSFHLATRYDSLADYTVFTQARVFCDNFHVSIACPCLRAVVIGECSASARKNSELEALSHACFTYLVSNLMVGIPA